MNDGYELDDDPARIDVEAVWRYLSLESYWAKGRSREMMEELVRSATRVVGLYAPGGEMVGFGRAVSDGHTIAHLADVYVLDEHRRRGLGAQLVRRMVEESSLRHLRWTLRTTNAHDHYRRFGFEDLGDGVMERPRRHPATDELREMGTQP